MIIGLGLPKILGLFSRLVLDSKNWLKLCPSSAQIKNVKLEPDLAHAY